MTITVWQNSDVADDFWQFFPQDSVKAVYGTEVRVAYNETTLYVAFLDESSESPLDDLDGFATWVGIWASRDFEPPENPSGLTVGSDVRCVTTSSEEGEENLISDSPYEDGDVLVLYLTNSAPQAGSWERIRLVVAVPPPAKGAE